MFLHYLLKERVWFSGKKDNIKYLFMRAGIGTVGILCNYYTIDRLVLSDASMLNKMSPFFAIIFSSFILREKVDLVQGILVTGAFMGSVLIIKPSSAIFSSPAALIGLLGGAAAGLAYTYVRVLGEKGEKGSFVVFVFSAFSCIVTFPFLIADYCQMDMTQLIMLLLAGLSAAGGQFSITAAYFYAPAREISIYDYSQIIFSTILGYLVFGQIPDIMSWIGYLVICIMAIAMFLYNHRKCVKV